MNLNQHLSTEDIEDEGDYDALIRQLSDENPRIPDWDGFDLDKTVAFFDTWKGPTHIGAPIPAMIEKIKQTIAEGRIAKIFTARVSYTDPRVNEECRKAIKAFCLEHVGVELEVTNIKDMGMRNLYDDRAWRVLENQGVVVGQNKHAPETVQIFHTELRKALGQ
jgi:hypothetical protein